MYTRPLNALIPNKDRTTPVWAWNQVEVFEQLNFNCTCLWEGVGYKGKLWKSLKPKFSLVYQ